MVKKIAVIGAGAWGSALASMSAALGHHVHLYGRDEATIDMIRTQNENPRYLPGIKLHKNIVATTDMAKALDQAERILLVIPAQTLGKALAEFAPLIPTSSAVILCSKGIEQSSGNFMSEIATKHLKKQQIAALSGPSFADDVARGLPTAVTIAANDRTFAHQLAHEFSGPRFRCYASDDIIGVEIGGALKNVLALAAGATRGCKLGASAEAALVTRGFAELRRIASTLGAKAETLTGLSVLGDLILTCSSPQSRNFSYGMALGEGRSTNGLRLAEGVATAPIAAKICSEKNIDAPIISAIANLLEGKISIDDAINGLINRPLKYED